MFETLAADAGKPKSVDDLSKPTGADPDLVARIARHLAAMAIIDEPKEAMYSSSKLCEALIVPKYAGGIRSLSVNFLMIQRYHQSIKLMN